MGNNRRFEIVAPSRHEFDLLTPPARPRIELRRARPCDLEAAARLAGQEIDEDLAGLSVVETALACNSNNALLFWRNDEIAGLWAMLMLNSHGLEALLMGEFEPTAPDIGLLARTAQAPAAIYVWAVVAPGLAAEGIRHVSRVLQQPLYAQANLYSRPNSDIAVRLNLNVGFRPVGPSMPEFYRYVRLDNRLSAVRLVA